jgi:two-component system, NtrC family, response regulator HydG
MAQTLAMPQTPEAPRTLKTLVDEYERQLILEALRAAGGQQRRAAATLGVLPSTLHEKMSRLGIPTARTYHP